MFQQTGLFGTTPAAGSSVFGAPAGAPAGGSIFGAPQPTAAPAGGSLFGAPQPTAAPAGGGIFGAPQPTAAPAGGSIFGAQPTATTGGSIFGAPQPTAAPAGGSIFGAPATGGSIFGGQTTQPNANIFGGTTTTSPAAGSVFGAAPAAGGFGAAPGKTYTVQELNTNSDLAAADVPKDSVASLVWSPTVLTMFATTSWDGLVRIYEATTAGVNMKAQQAAPKAMLSAAWSDDGMKLFFGGIDNKCYLWNLQTNQLIPVGVHNDIIERVFVVPGQGVFGTVSADRTVKYWDVRAGTTPAAASMTVQLGYNPSAFDARSTSFVVSNFAQAPAGTFGSTSGGTTVFGYDLRRPDQPATRQESVLKLSTCSLGVFSDLSGFAIASVEGRCSLQYWNEDPVRQTGGTHRSFAFRCHRVDSNKAYSVHDIHFHPKNADIFSTVGGDGEVCFWDKNARHRLRLFNKVPLAITQGKFNLDGSLFAYAAGYDWAEGADAAVNKRGVGVFVHAVTQREVEYKKTTDRRY